MLCDNEVRTVDGESLDERVLELAEALESARVNDRRPPESTLFPVEVHPRLEALSRLELPLVLVGGATGTGKSTVATEVAHRLGITRVTSTDVVRQTMRAFFSAEFMPSIHYSSFEAGKAVSRVEGDKRDPNLTGFLDQTRNVLVGVHAVLGRRWRRGIRSPSRASTSSPGWFARRTAP